ncbi:hypothetical protein [Streptomyces sp. NPDC057582]|uniref:hypothetical protein n=1 Tax=Streptomyces sp. NPDC057582 TaxID=3346174 RepID=UPI0036A46D93
MESEDSGRSAAHRRLLARIGIVAAIGLFAGQGAAIIIQQGQIDDLKARAAQPGPRGETGPQGIPGPRGIAGPAGKNGKNGNDAVSATAPTNGGLTNGRATQMTVLEARAYCTDLAAKAYPDSTSSDPSMDALTDSYTSTMRERSFNDCMSDEGYPQP